MPSAAEVVTVVRLACRACGSTFTTPVRVVFCPDHGWGPDLQAQVVQSWAASHHLPTLETR